MRRASIFTSETQNNNNNNATNFVPFPHPSPTHLSLLGHLQDCTQRRDLASGRLCYDHLLKNTHHIDSFWFDRIIRLFAVCGDLSGATHVFDRVAKPSIYTWNAIISAHVQLQDPWGALLLYRKLLHFSGLLPDRLSYLWTLKSCSLLCDVVQGRIIQIHIIMNGLGRDHVLSNTIVGMFAKSGSFEEAQRAFDGLLVRDQVSWGALISGYAQNGHGLLALELYEKMREESIAPDRVILLSITKAIATIHGVMIQGRMFHNEVVTNGLEFDLAIGSCLIDMYGKCGSIEEAEALFNRLPKRNVVSWGSLIGAVLSQGSDQTVLDLYNQMIEEGIEPDRVIFLCVLKACGNLGALHQGHIIDDLLRRRDFDVDIVLGTTLIEMYVNCGYLKDAYKVITKLPSQNNVSWNAMIAGCAVYGDGDMMEKCLDKMMKEGLRPDQMGVTQILTSCSHSGSLEHGQIFFDALVSGDGDMPTIEHYTCMVDLLGRAGCLDLAESLVETMPIPPDNIVWRSLLSTCESYSNVKLGNQCFNELKKLDAIDESAYTLISRHLCGC